jgi:hypothetical protein
MSLSSSEDDNVSELSIEHEKQLNERLAEVCGDTPADDPANAFLKDFFANRKWVQHQKSAPLKSDSDDLEEIDDALEFEKRYNFRHQEPGSTVIESHPRRVEGESRESETARHRKRREQAETGREQTEENQTRLQEIDSRYRILAGENGGHLTSEQLKAWVDEVCNIEIPTQEERFEYTEVAANGGIEKSVRILEGPDEEEGTPDDEGEQDQTPVHRRFRGGFRGGFRERGRGRGRFRGTRGNGRGGRAISTERMGSYFAHRH